MENNSVSARIVVEESFTDSVCMYLLDNWHTNLYRMNHRSDFKSFYKALSTDSRAIVNKWIMDVLVQYNLWNHWDPLQEDPQ